MIMNRMYGTSIIRKVSYLFIFYFVSYSYAQSSDDYLGNGDTNGVVVSGSDTGTENNPNNTLIGATGGIAVKTEANAVRFLQQATLGYDYEDMQHLHAIGIEAWFEEQKAMPQNSLTKEYKELLDYAQSQGATITLQSNGYVGYSFYNKVINDDDQLRLRTAFALSQILVVSGDGINREADLITDYFDILYTQAFGNFRDILYDMTLHRGMGIYLSYINNMKEDVAAGTFPDENFAREIMQLFTIGLYELNTDGSPRLNGNGNFIPTYDNEDIVQLAKVFTGLVKEDDSYIMAVKEANHDVGEKIMIDGSVLPANQNTLTDINAALDVLFNHKNIAPFISKHLIKQLVKSNPTPGYVYRVASIFNNNGSGVRGDMEAVFKAILFDTEARDCVWENSTSAGKLLQPIEKFMFLFKALHISAPSGRIYTQDYRVWDNQRVLESPTVFNFFSPYYAEPRVVAPAGLVSPEFQIFNSIGSIQSYNNLRAAIKTEQNIRNYTASNPEGDGLSNNADVDTLEYDLSFEENLYETQGTAALVDYYNLLLCRNQLTETMQIAIEDAIDQYELEDSDYNAHDAVTDVVLFIATSPVFNVLN